MQHIVETSAASGPPRLSVCQITTKYLSFQDDINAYEAAGIDGISLWYQKALDHGLSQAAALLKSKPLQVVSMVGVPFLLGDGRGKEVAATDSLRHVLDDCATLGVPILGVVPGNCDGRSSKEMHEATIRSLIALAPEAASRGVTLALEPIHAPYFDFLNTLEEAHTIVEAVAHPSVKILFDVWHLCHEPDLEVGMKEAANQIGLVHFSDWREPTRYHDDRLLPGGGVLPLAGILRSLHDNGYRGSYDVEVFSEDIWRADQNANLRQIRRFFDDVWSGAAR